MPFLKQLACCPHCHHEQEEPSGAVSTNCRACSRYFSVESLPSKRVVRTPRPTRFVVCRTCGLEARAVETAVSTMCEQCSTCFNLLDYRLTRTSSEPLVTYGNVEFASGCTYRGKMVHATCIKLSGHVNAIVRADRDIHLADHGRAEGSLVAPVIRVIRAAKATAQKIETELLEVHGHLKGQKISAAVVRVFSGGLLESDFLTAREVIVESGGALLADFESMPPRPAAEIEPNGFDEDQFVLLPEDHLLEPVAAAPVRC